MVEGEGEMNEDLVGDALGLVVLLDDVVDVLRAKYNSVSCSNGRRGAGNLPSPWS